MKKIENSPEIRNHKIENSLEIRNHKIENFPEIRNHKIEKKYFEIPKQNYDFERK